LSVSQLSSGRLLLTKQQAIFFSLCLVAGCQQGFVAKYWLPRPFIPGCLMRLFV
jgi:hypothetical protein